MQALGKENIANINIMHKITSIKYGESRFIIQLLLIYIEFHVLKQFWGLLDSLLS